MNRSSPTRVAVAVGFLGLAAGVASAQCFSWAAAQSANLPPGREFAGLAYDPDNSRLILAGGDDAAGQRSDVWAFNGAAWTQLPSLPYPQSDQSLVYDAARHRLVSFGGQPAFMFNNLMQEFDGTSWQAISFGEGPGASSEAAYDAARGEIIALSSSGTWAYTAQAGWVVRTTTGPAFHVNTTLAYDSYRQRVVLFGGTVAGSLTNDVWEWDGAVWTQVILPNGPSPRRHTRMAFDAGRGRMVIYGGVGPAGFLSDTWEYNSSAWTQMAGGTPVARQGPALAYDASVGSVVMFGGLIPGGNWSSEFYRAQTPIPAILEQPQSVDAIEGGPAMFHVRPSYSSALFFTWYKNGAPIPGATTACLSIPNVTGADAGEYRVSVGGQCAAAYSIPVQLRVRCYANCDASTTVPTMNVQDFACFLNKFAAGCP